MEKDRTYRDRTKRKRSDPKDNIHPVHRPYERDHTNWKHSVVIDGLGDYDGSDAEGESATTGDS